MSVPQIRNIEKLFHLVPGTITEQKFDRLTAPGENYGSLMLSVELTIKTTDGDKHIYAVAKMVPPNVFLQKVFNTQVTFRNEIQFYKSIVPLLQNFQKENAGTKVVNFAPEYYGSRLNLTGGDEVDEDAVLLLENLKIAGFVTLDRIQGLDMNVAKYVLTDLAHLHAVALAFKLKKPEIFNNEIKPFLVKSNPGENILEYLINDLTNITEQIEELKPLKERILKGAGKVALPYTAREPFATIVHDDCWTNNAMLKIKNSEPMESKLVDYQMCFYGSPARDIIFFLFSSVKNEVLIKHYDNLLKFYHEVFISVLQELKCDTTLFNFDAFLKEIDYEAEFTQFGHISFMLVPIFAERDKVKDLSEFHPEDMAKNALQVTDLHKEKLIFVVNEFIKRNWI